MQTLKENRIFNFLIAHKSELEEKFAVRKIALFGSYARGEETDESDIDLLVDFREPTFDNYINLVFFLEESFKKKVQLVTEGPQLRERFLKHIETDLMYV